MLSESDKAALEDIEEALIKSDPSLPARFRRLDRRQLRTRRVYGAVAAVAAALCLGCWWLAGAGSATGAWISGFFALMVFETRQYTFAPESKLTVRSVYRGLSWLLRG